MRRRIIGSACSAAVLVAAVVSAQDTKQASAQPITVTGCVAQATSAATAASGEAGHEARDLILTKATTSSRGAETPSAVPGSLPSGSGTGTVPVPPSAKPSGSSDTAMTTYALAGTQEAQLKRYVGQRVEVVGTIAIEGGVPTPAPTGAARAAGAGVADERARGTSGDKASPEAAATGDTESARNVTATGGRTEPPASATAHPSAASVRLMVTSFKTVAGTCQ